MPFTLILRPVLHCPGKLWYDVLMWWCHVTMWHDYLIVCDDGPRDVCFLCMAEHSTNAPRRMKKMNPYTTEPHSLSPSPSLPWEGLSVCMKSCVTSLVCKSCSVLVKNNTYAHTVKRVWACVRVRRISGVEVLPCCAVMVWPKVEI